MTKMKFVAAAAIMTSLVATPVLAQGLQEASQNTSHLKKQQMKSSNLRRDRANIRYDDRMGFNDSYARNDSGFFPVDAAAGIVGGAVNTAGAVASAPFRDNDVVNDDRYNDGYGYNRGYRDSYAAVNNSGRVGAFATAPYTNPYEYNRTTAGYDGGWYGQSYAQRNGFVCEPGTVFTNANGIRMLCQ